MKKLLFLWFSFTFIAYSQQEYILNANTNGQTITTCQGIFLDSGGANDNYGINENYTITICPETQENFLQVTFSQFQLENNWDRLYIHNGNSVSDPLVLSSNGPGNGSCNTQAGGWWNNQLEGQAITSTHSSGCLTFRFCSDDNVNQGGWVANLNCVSGIDCPNPSNITATNIQPSSVDVNWTENGSATSWEVIISPLGSQIPSNAIPINPANVYSSLPVNISNLLENTDYVIFVRAICDINQETASISNWSASTPFSTSTTPLGCGGTFTDSGGPTNNYSNNENNTTTICPDTPNSFVQVIFTQFQLETNWDKLYIHNGSSVNDPLILSPNDPGLGACNDQSGGWWGNQLQGQTILSSNPSGCLTFRFCSDASVTQAGWIAVVNCISAENSHIISVQPFLDSNNNGIKDPNEPVFAFGELVLLHIVWV